MNRITIFTWGYYSWGNHTPQLLRGVDAVEADRGFKPPKFVDIRIRRAVRALGFKGSSFERLLGQDRYRWLKSLGNKFIESRTGPTVQIAEPEAANEVLDLAIGSARHKQRLIFFCGCQWPRIDGKITCHRTTVAGLVLKAARKRGIQIEIVEWPGGDLKRIDLQITAKDFAAIRGGRKSAPLGKRFDLAKFAGLPWGSLAALHSNGKNLHRIVGPAISQTSGWVLPVLDLLYEPATGLSQLKQDVKKLRKNRGLEALVS